MRPIAVWTALCSLCVLPLFLQSNNIAVSNVALVNENEQAQTAVIRFDVSWEHSWRMNTGPSNWDAAWVFAKYRQGTDPWQHARLIGVGDQPSGAVVTRFATEGAMVYRDAVGGGDVNFTDVELVWNYGVDGLTGNGEVEIQVFAIEMVYIPEEAFFVGDGRTDIQKFHSGGNSPSAYRIDSEAAITVSNTAGNLYYNGSGDQSGPIPAAFPKGFGAFYCMKYEPSQQQWVDFFNTLTPGQRTLLDMTDGSGKDTDNEDSRNGVSYTNNVTATTTLPNIPMAFVNIKYALSYLDWAALRPMTELEYEKICRGDQTPVPNELAWGTTEIADEAYTLANPGLPDEVPANPHPTRGNVVLTPTRNGFNGPIRCGAFAAAFTNTTRVQAGSAYYGVMEMSGNLWERVVTVGTARGRQYTGLHGDGTLAVDGDPDVPNWSVDNPAAFGLRGMGYDAFGSAEGQTSARNLAASPFDEYRFNIALFRGIRSL